MAMWRCWLLAAGIAPFAKAIGDDACSGYTDLYSCHGDHACTWCSGGASSAHCISVGAVPAANETCSTAANCTSFTTGPGCDAEITCKWCTAAPGNGASCTDLTAPAAAGVKCDKSRQVAAVQDTCGANANVFQCHYNIECIWCQSPEGPGRCTNWTSTPRTGEICDGLVGCDGHRTQSSCHGDATCKWCHTFTQGWPFCARVTDDTSGSASCDKLGDSAASAERVLASRDEDWCTMGLPNTCPAGDVCVSWDGSQGKCQPKPTGVEDACAANSNVYQCHYNIECVWCRSHDGPGRCANWTSTPRTGEMCDALVGCPGHRTQSLCDGDATCKWCHMQVQGWPFCAKLSDETGSASCDKSVTSDLPQVVVI